MTSIKDVPRVDAADYIGRSKARGDYMTAALEEGGAAEVR
jgi:hypothetical protein